jgi:hypothetical protein
VEDKVRQALRNRVGLAKAYKVDGNGCGSTGEQKQSLIEEMDLNDDGAIKADGTCEGEQQDADAIMISSLLAPSKMEGSMVKSVRDGDVLLFSHRNKDVMNKKVL